MKQNCLATLALLSLAAQGVCTVAAAQQSARSDVISISSVAKTVVTLEVRAPGGSVQGSGVLIDSLGTIATAAHVIANATEASAKLSSGEVLQVEGVVALDSRYDIALVRVAGYSLPAARLGNSDIVGVGQRLVAIGAPLGLEATVSDGLLSAVRVFEGVKFFQISVPISHGSSGGPLFNANGEVVALVDALIPAAQGQNLNFAVPINYVRGMLEMNRGRPLMTLSDASARPTVVPASPNGPVVVEDRIPSKVNTFFTGDLSVLSGLEVSSTFYDEAGYTHRRYETCRVGLSPDSAPRLECAREEHVEYAIGIGKQEIYVDRVRDIYDQGSPARVQEAGQRRGVKQGQSSFTWDIRIKDTTYTSQIGGATTSGKVPQGTLPEGMLLAAVAMLPPYLPRDAYVWLFDPLSGQLNPVHASFGHVTALDVSMNAASCLDADKVTKSTLSAAAVTLASGASTSVGYVISTQPHIMFDLRSLKCLKLPDAK
jgi:hypothetical protein